ncbi:aminoacyl tRNA synthase complex-interacting multifunctional protein 2-like isoform X2 [Nymphalis io]|uniref:aminoacyl tRNA synthase complex-interacting multifunctional protein 2-like isoform X2 n=1 Tax=Inachis io TaxID=171585 RepID=UPI00216951CA|nr:aminoacyl tRNA synthase complex-interacting multifunctional protein 2-like isoform X2 [Nymphalis io]
MYQMKNILTFENEIVLPKCMYPLKNPIEVSEKVNDINISEQKMPNTHLLDLEERQDKLLQKLDILYERIKTISSFCTLENQQGPINKSVAYDKPDDIVLILNVETLPWFLNIFLKTVSSINVSWHILSTVPPGKAKKIKDFFIKFQELYQLKKDAKINFRLIFKHMAKPQMKLSSLSLPIRGTVSIIRYLCLIYKDIVPYEYNNQEVDELLDIFNQIEFTSDENRQTIISKLFLYCDTWILNDNFSIVDLAAFNIIKLMPNGYKFVTKKWLQDCENLIF